MEELRTELEALLNIAEADRTPEQIERINEIEDLIAEMEAPAEGDIPQENTTTNIVVSRCNTTRTGRAFVVNGQYIISRARMRNYGILYDWQLMRRTITGEVTGEPTPQGLRLFQIQEVSGLEKYQKHVEAAVAAKMVDLAFQED